ncbi:hypothetical protein PRK78_004773 [Emydomyces testavorans]|uniref:OPA3-like protein n=1 Tax=Emydomyces testavorans TaxID=2070801 RepID=A0AAF0DIC8_9EURO|nr:hypothetical protein PRK78_004773 [Emydomyces testavorans]
MAPSIFNANSARLLQSYVLSAADDGTWDKRNSCSVDFSEANSTFAMASITLKLSSLVIRTLSKPIANQIKAQAREHERFRRICISFAQNLHQVDMRLRLGLLQSTAQIERQVAREAAEAHAKKHKHHIPTVKTEAQMKADEAAAARGKEKNLEPPVSPPTPRIRPLSEAKAIDMGANFISEAFLFMVAGGLIVFESWRSRRKATSRREDMTDRLNELEDSEKAARMGLIALEKEVLHLRAQLDKKALKDVPRVLPEAIRHISEEPEPAESQNIFEKLKDKLQRFQGIFADKNPPEPDPATKKPNNALSSPGATKLNPSQA